MWVILVLAVNLLLLPRSKMLLSKARSFNKAVRCHLAAHAEEGKKPVFLGVVIRVRKAYLMQQAGPAAWKYHHAEGEGALSRFSWRNLFGLKPSLGHIKGGRSAIGNKSLQ